MNNILFRFKFDYKHTGHHRDCKEGLLLEENKTMGIQGYFKRGMHKAW